MDFRVEPFSGVALTENIWCVFGVKVPVSNLSGIEWTEPKILKWQVKYKKDLCMACWVRTEQVTATGEKKV